MPKTFKCFLETCCSAVPSKELNPQPMNCNVSQCYHSRDEIMLGIPMGSMGMGTARWEWAGTPHFPIYHPQVADHQTLLMDPVSA